VLLFKYKHKLNYGILEKSKLNQHAYEDGCEVDWDEARILETQSNCSYRKYKESGDVKNLTIPVSLPNFHLSHMDSSYLQGS
jgi:hypothetical protein